MQDFDDADCALHYDLCLALERVKNGTSTVEDARLLAFAAGINPADVGIAPRHPVMTIDNELTF